MENAAPMASSKRVLGASKNIQNRPSPISTYPHLSDGLTDFRAQSLKKRPHLGEGLGTKIVFPADPPTPFPMCRQRAAAEELPGGGRVRSGIGEAPRRRNCRVYDAWRAKAAIA